MHGLTRIHDTRNILIRQVSGFAAHLPDIPSPTRKRQNLWKFNEEMSVFFLGSSENESECGTNKLRESLCGSWMICLFHASIHSPITSNPEKTFTPYIYNASNKRPKGPHIVHLSTMCQLFWQISQGRNFCLLIGLKNTHLVEDVEILLPVKFRWIPFSGFREEVENVPANQRPGRPSYFSDLPEKTQTW